MRDRLYASSRFSLHDIREVSYKHNFNWYLYRLVLYRYLNYLGMMPTSNTCKMAKSSRRCSRMERPVRLGEAIILGEAMALGELEGRGVGYLTRELLQASLLKAFDLSGLPWYL